MTKKYRRPISKEDRIFAPNIHGGWNPRAHRYMDAKGRYASREKALNDGGPTENIYSHLGGVRRITAPASEAYESIEVSLFSDRPVEMPSEIKKYKTSNMLVAAFESAMGSRSVTMPKANLMPTPMRARMILSENFWNTDGDCDQVVDTPVDLLYKTPFVENASTELRSEVEDMMRKWCLDSLLPEMWKSIRVFGVTHPYEIWSGSVMSQIVPLPPLYVHIGYNAGATYALSPEMGGEDAWDRRVARSAMHPAMFKNVTWHWNYNAPATEGLDEGSGGVDLQPVEDIPIDKMKKGVAWLNAANLNPIFDSHKFTWYRYAMPMLSFGFRDLTDLYVYEDTVRRLIEGTKYQLWTFHLGSESYRPTPQEVQFFKAAIESLEVEKTGTFVWTDPYTVKVIMPEGLDKMIGNDHYSIKKKNFYRKMGITSTVVSGEKPGTFASSGGGGGGGGASDIDVRIYLEKSRFQWGCLEDWVKYLIKKQIGAERSKSAGIKEADKIRIRLPWSDIEMESMFKNVFLQGYESGLFAEEQALRAANLHYEDTVQAKRNAKKDREDGLFDPPMTNKQSVLSPDGERKIAQTEPGGSPNAAAERRNRMGRTTPGKGVTEVDTGEGQN